MPEILYGKNRGEKTQRIYEMIAGDIAAGKRCILIVPEQNVLEAETALADRGVYSLSLDVFSFSRLANAVFRKYGGLSYNYISDAGKAVAAWKAMRLLSGALEKYVPAGNGDMSLVTLVLSVINELQMSSVTPEMLVDAAETIVDNDDVRKSFTELAQIYSLYVSILHEKYNDRSDDLTLAEKILLENGYFDGCRVYIDSFSGFTVQELGIVQRIFAESERCVVTLGYGEDDDIEAFSRLKRTDDSLRRIARKAGAVLTSSSYIAKNDEAERSFIQDNLFRPHVSDKLAKSGFTSIVRCPDKYSEVTAVAVDIREKLIKGARYKDFTVIARDLGDYSDVIRSVFEKYDIPVFISDRTQVRNMPLTRLIYSAMYSVIKSFSYDDVITYIKTGFANALPEECDLIVRYAAMWKINGRKWYDENIWHMNPDGFGEPFDEETEKTLDEIERIRRAVISPLAAFSESFTDRTTVRDVCAALFRFMKDLDVASKLERYSSMLRSEGKNAEAEEAMQLWNAVIDILDTLVDVAGEQRITASEYQKLLEIMFAKTNIGKIPPQIDTVSFESADLYRDSEAGYVYILGVNEGVFPAPVSEVSIISDTDREELKKAGIDLSGANNEEKYADEYLHFYNAVTSAVKGITVTYNTENRNSVAVNSLKELYESYEETDFRNIREDLKAASPVSALEYALTHRNETTSGIILEHLSKTEKFSEIIDNSSLTLTESKCSVGKEITSRIAGGKIVLSQSKAEAYVDCPFKYFCRYVVRIRPDASGDVESNDIGNYVHRVLELFFSEMSGRDFRTITSDEIDLTADRIIEEYKNSLFRYDPGKKTGFLFERLSKLSKLMISNVIAEFSSSRFRPVLFEFPIGGNGGIESFPVQVDEETVVKMIGAIDRVDSYVSGGKVYVRVVDYKTGKKKFSVKDAERGINMQMLIYLFTLCSSENSLLKEKLGGTAGSELVPAGVLYMLAGTPDTDTLDSEPDKTRSDEVIKKSIVRSGLLINDTDVLLAMEEGLKGDFIPVKLKKDGTLSGSSAAGPEVFAELKDTVTRKISEIARDIKSGRADAAPLKDGKYHDACEYCDMKPICRRREDAKDE